MTFCIIGNGNMAWFLSKRIQAAGHQCKGIFGRDAAGVKQLADALLVSDYGAISSLTDDMGDVCFLAVSDAAVSSVAVQLRLQKTVLIHLAGAVPMGVLKGAAADFGIIWPVFSINRQQLPGNTRNIPCAWEASSERSKRFIREMGHAITDELFEATETQRQWLHLTAVISNNFINHLLAVSEQLCRDHDLPYSLVQPLITQTFERAKNHSAGNSQTGPAARNDAGTIAHHISMLEMYPALQPVYQSLSESIMGAGKTKS